jgi:hypothetical protein
MMQQRQRNFGMLKAVSVSLVIILAEILAQIKALNRAVIPRLN